jgi:hypothetical protein
MTNFSSTNPWDVLKEKARLDNLKKANQPDRPEPPPPLRPETVIMAIFCSLLAIFGLMASYHSSVENEAYYQSLK